MLETDSEILYREIIGSKERNWRIYPYVRDIQTRRLKFASFECRMYMRLLIQLISFIVLHTKVVNRLCKEKHIVIL